jgi:hypothetical protein
MSESSPVESLDEKAKRLDASRKNLVKLTPVGVRMDILLEIAHELNSNPELKGMFGDPVINKLAVISEGGDLKICDAKIVQLSDQQQKRFIAILSEIMLKKIAVHGGGRK